MMHDSASLLGITPCILPLQVQQVQSAQVCEDQSAKDNCGEANLAKTKYGVLTFILQAMQPPYALP